MPHASIVFFIAATRSTEIYTLSLHDALPISRGGRRAGRGAAAAHLGDAADDLGGADLDRKSTRLNSSHLGISYAVFCLKKKNQEHDESIHLTIESKHRKLSKNRNP